jgi:hypothetical protein
MKVKLAIATVALVVVLGTAIYVYALVQAGISAQQQFVSGSKAYTHDASVWVSRYEQIDKDLDALSAAPVLTDAGWQSKVRKALGDLRVTSLYIQKYKPAVFYSAWHFGLVKDIAVPYENYANLYAEGANSLDLDKISQAQATRSAIDVKLRQFKTALAMQVGR